MVSHYMVVLLMLTMLCNAFVLAFSFYLSLIWFILLFFASFLGPYSMWHYVNIGTQLYVALRKHWVSTVWRYVNIGSQLYVALLPTILPTYLPTTLGLNCMWHYVNIGSQPYVALQYVNIGS